MAQSNNSQNYKLVGKSEQEEIKATDLPTTEESKNTTEWYKEKLAQLHEKSGKNKIERWNKKQQWKIVKNEDGETPRRKKNKMIIQVGARTCKIMSLKLVPSLVCQVSV